VLGDVVNTAARLQASAGRGEILIGEHLFEAIQGSFMCSEVGARVVAGQVAPVMVYNVERRIADETVVAAAPTMEVSSYEGVTGLTGGTLRSHTSSG